MRKLHSKKGFTLMEMLIVVAIIVILVAIAIPTFTGALEKAREATDIANIRAAYAEAMMEYLDGNGEALDEPVTSEVMTQATAGWESAVWPAYLGELREPDAGDTITVTVGADGVAVVTLVPGA